MFNKKNKIKASLSKEVLSEYFKNSSDKIICRAPFASLYFHPYGEVSACCLNKSKFSYGKYPEQRIKQIITSTPRKLQQKHLKANNLLLGCEICQENIVTRNISGILATGYKYLQIKKHITRIDFELSNYCNINCIMCERDKSKKKIIYDYNFIEEIKPYLKKLEFANFIGGEPFVIEIYYKIWDILLKENPNCKISIQTNGTIFNSKIKDLLERGNFYVNISLDALDERLYNDIRKGARLDNVLQNFEKFNSIMQKKNHIMQISVCPMRINWQEIPKLVEFANINNCQIFFNHVDYPGYLSLKYTSPSFLQNIIKHFIDSANYIVVENNISNNNFESLKGLIKLIENWKLEEIKRELNSSFITKSDVSKLLLQKTDNKHKELVIYFINEVPKTWLISNERLAQIEKFDFNTQLNIFSSEHRSKEDILDKFKSFFELYRTENLKYE